MSSKGVADVLPLTPLQRGLVYLARRDGGEGLDPYTIQLVLDGRDGRPDSLQAALDTVLARHDVLRAAIRDRKRGEPVAVVPTTARVGWRAETVASVEEADELVDDERRRPFDLARPPLVRALLVYLSDGAWRFAVTLHHAVVDGWSLGPLLREVLTTAEGGTPPEPVPFRRHLEHLATLDHDAAARRIADDLAGIDEPTRLLPPLPAEVAELPASVTVELPPVPEGFTLATTLQAAWGIVLARLTGRDDVVFGTTVSGRPAALEGVEDMVGPFVATLPVRVSVGSGSVRSLLDDLARRGRDRLSDEHADLAAVGRLTGLPGELFDTLLVVENVGLDPSKLARLAPSLGVESVAIRDATHYPVSVVALPAHGDEPARLRLVHRRDAVSDADARTLLDRLVRVLAALSDLDAPIASIEVTSSDERRALVAAAADPAGRSTPTTWPAMFAAAAALDPGKPAVVVGGPDPTVVGTLTWAELDERSAGLAGALVERGAGPGAVVGVSLPRSPELIVALAAVLRSGAAYLPLDPDYPAERLAYMLADSGARLVVSDGSSPVSDGTLQTLDVSDVPSLTPTLPEPHPDDAAYLIYTSGSTGRPKGVVVPHAGIADLMATATDPERLAVTADSTVAMFASVSFDLAFFEMSMALCLGGTLVVVPTALRAPDHALAEYLRDHHVTHAALPPSVSGALPADAPLPTGMTILVGTEAVPTELVARWGHDRRLFDAYGPTEVTVNATLGALRPDDVARTGAAPIGRVDAGGRAYVLDRRLQPVPVGVAGELYLAGAGLARGYHGRPDLTAERFLADPFRSGERMYRTGDLVRRRPAVLPDGTDDPWPGELDYLGRVDEQVSLRGFRVEPGEVSAVLAEDPAVGQALVVVRRDGGRPQLVGYVTPGEGAPDPTALRALAAERLPEHMVPAAVVVLDAFPLTPNAKIDRARLPAPEFVAGAGRAAETDAERALCAVLAEVLEVDDVGPDDDFFALGGDSIVALSLVGRARRAGWTVTPRQVVEQRTAGALAAVAVPVPDEGAAPVVDDGVGTVALTPVARDFLARGGPIARYHQRVALTVPAEATAESLTAALDAVLARHDLLRARLVRPADGPPVLEVPAADALRGADVLGEVHDHRDDEGPDAQPLDPRRPDDLAVAVEDAVGRFDPEDGRVLAAASTGDRLVLAAHHLVVDAVSWRVIVDDLRDAHAAVLAGETPRLDPVPTSFRTWTADQSVMAEKRAGEREHWRAAAPREGDPVLTDRPSGTVGEQTHHHVTVPPEVAAPLLGAVPTSIGGTVDDVVLAAVLLAVTRWSGTDGVVVDRERYGRETDTADLSRTVGWFTVTHPLRLALPGDASLDATLKAVKEQRRATPGDGAGYGLLRTVAGEDLGPTPPLLVNYLGRSAVRADDGPFAPAPEAPVMTGGADEAMPLGHALEVNARTEDREDGPHLVVRWSTAAVDADVVSTLADGFVAACRELAAADIGGATPSDFPTVALTQADVDALGDVEDVVPPAPLAEGLLATAALADDADLYAVHLEIDLSGPLDDDHRAALDRAATALIARHDALRETFPQVSSGRWVTAIGREPVSEHWGYRTTDTGLVIDAHHAILDGWSTPVLVREWFALWTAALAHPEADPAALVGKAGLGPTYPHRRHLTRLAERHAGPEGDAARAAWADALAGLDGPTLLADALPGGSGDTAIGFRDRTLDEALTADLRALARDRGVTLATILQVAWALVLARTTGRDDVVLGQTVSGRPPEVEGIDTAVGLYITTVPVRVRLHGSDLGDREPLADLVGRVQAEQAALLDHQDLGLQSIQRAAGVGDLFDTVLVVENYPLDPSAADDAAPEGLGVTAVRNDDAPHYPAGLVVTPGGDGVELRLTHRGSVDADTLLDRVEAALVALARSPEEATGSVDLLDDATRAAVLEPGETREVPTTSLAGLVVDGLRSGDRDAVAVVGPDGTVLTRAELDERSGALAASLAARGIGPEHVVGVALPRSAELIVALVGVLRAGAAYLPLDPDYPADRVDYMVADSGASLVLGPGLNGSDGTSLTSSAGEVPSLTPDPDDPAYVIYTSGSTGRPKGVVVSHAAIVNRLVWMQDRYGLGDDDAVLQKTPSSFDVSVWEFFWPLMTGARLVFAAPGRHGDPEHLVERIDTAGVTTMHFVPSMLRPFLDHVETHGAPASLRRIVCSGEGLPVSTARRCRELLGDVELHNLYGPTEAAVDVTAAQVRGDEAAVPIGAPIHNTGVRVLDRRLRSVGFDVAGELYLTGVQLARGYLGRPALTADRFVADPDGPPGARMYRTGDVVRRSRDGLLYHLGRADDQVKIRGFRVELGEVAAALEAEPEVAQAVASVVMTAAGAVRLVAHVVARGDLDTAELVARLAGRLPEHLVPAAVAVVDEFPLSPSGKVDRGALPPVDRAPDSSSRTAESPVEEALAAAVAAVLERDTVGVDDDFLALGGDSILAIAVVARARAAGVVVTPRQVLTHRTVAALAAVAADAPDEQAAEIVDPDEAPLVPIAQALLAAGAWRRFHQWRAFVAPDGDPAAALAELVRRHPALRMRVDEDARRLVLIDAPVPPLDHVETDDLAAAASAVADRLDPASGVVIAGAHVTTRAGARLVVVIHHVAVDAVSWLRIGRELTGGGSDDRARGYAAWARRLADDAPAQRTLLPGWAAVLRRDNSALPLRGPLQADRDVASAVHHRELRIEGAGAMGDVGALVGGGAEDVLLAALALAVARVGKAGPLVVEVEAHGRPDEVDLDEVVGWFTTAAPVRLDLRGLTPSDLVRALRRAVVARRALPGPDRTFGQLRWLDDEGARLLGALPPPEIAVNYLGRTSAPAHAVVGKPGDPAPEAPGLHGGGDPDRPATAHLSLDAVLEGDTLVARLAWPGPALDDEVVSRLLDALTETVPALAALTRDDLGALANPTRAAVTAPLDDAGLEQVLDAVAPARVVDVAPPAPLAEGLLLWSGETTDADPYTIQLTLPLDGGVDDAAVERLGAAVEATVARHDALRTVLPAGPDGRPVAVVLADPPAGSFRTVDGPLDDVRAEDRRRFDLARGPLLRATLVPGHLVLTVHHVAVDGWSMPILVRDLLAAWSGTTLQPAPAYRDHLAALAARDDDADLAAWREHLAGLPGPTRVVPDATIDDPVPSRLPVPLDDALRADLRALARRRSVTPATLLQVAWALVLGWTTGTEDVVMLQTVSGRGGSADVAGTVGLFINTVPVRVRPVAASTVGDLLERVRDEQAALTDVAHVGLSTIQRAAGTGPDLADTLLVVENYPVDGTAPAGPPGITVGPIEADDGTHYPLCVVAAGRDGLDVHLAHHLPDDAAQAWAGRLARALAALVDDERPVGRVDLLDEAERRLVVHDWNDTGVPDSDRTWPEFFAAQVAERADAPAVVGEDLDGATVSWTYAELDERSGRVATALRARGLGPGDVVGVALPRTPDLVAALVGVLRAGAAYLPLDPDYPADRLRFTVADAAVRVVLTEASVSLLLPDVERLEVGSLVDDAAFVTSSVSKAAVLTPELSPEDAAYVIHTSGSTGRPKGVVLPHRVVPSLVATAAQRLGVRAGTRVLQFASPGFDVAFWELTMALALGGTLVVAPSRVRLPDRALTDFLAHQQVGEGDVLILPPALVAALPDDAVLPDGAVLLVGTEAVPPAVIERWAARLRVFNAYGPTEAAVNSTLGETDPASGASGRVPIGVPDPHTRALVLDAALRPVPPGGVGELYLGGPGLARGYLNRPDLTAERFVADPFGAEFGEPGGRLYRTGDVVRRMTDGRLDHLGRADDQVKVRGYRIELGEVAAAVAAAPGVARAVADTRPGPGNTRRLVAWLVPSGRHVGESLVRRHLTARLPAAMVPTDLVVVDALPTLPSGKIDRAALPEPPSAGAAATPPRDDAERAVAAVFADVLDLDGPPDVHTAFTDLGGHSLLLPVLRARLAEHGVEVSVQELLARPTVAEVAPLLGGSGGGPGSRWVPLRRGEGRAVVLLPGAGGAALPYTALAASLPDRPVWALQGAELLGVPGPDTTTAVVDDVLAQLTALGAGPVDLVGWSYGGVVAQAVAVAGADVASLTLLDAWPGLDEMSDGQDPAAFLGDVLGAGPVDDEAGLEKAVAADPDLAALYPPDVLAGAVRHVGHAREVLRAHHPAPLDTDVPVTVVVAGPDPERARAVWGRVLPGHARFVTVDTTHLGLLRPGAAESVGRFVRETISRTIQEENS
ncbi:non-ribosomal peptide synthetase [Actinomycetospora atypica]|uniref:Amino acid adenylation domain-containing protein n=1 Tax=Actinomycetospora atypica TaxID=1290095 RepID=A0ABV9YQW6_9PSEU